MKPQSRPVLVAIVGGSGAGKSWLADRLEKALSTGVTRLAQDDFYRDLSHLTFSQRERVNFDNPRSIDWPLLEQVLRRWLDGKPAAVPSYDFAVHTRRPETRSMKPGPVILVDGLWLLRRASLRRLFNLRIFVDCPGTLRLSRRIERDVRERGRTRASVLARFRSDVAPMHRRFVAPQVRWATNVVPSPVPATTVRQLTAEIRRIGSGSELKS